MSSPCRSSNVEYRDCAQVVVASQPGANPSGARCAPEDAGFRETQSRSKVCSVRKMGNEEGRRASIRAVVCVSF